VIQFQCPACQLLMQSQPGQKCLCPGCGQKILAPPEPANKTRLGVIPSNPPPAKIEEVLDEVEVVDEPDEPKRKRPGFACPFCKTRKPPRAENKITTAGWVVFGVLVLSCFGWVVCWVPLMLMREDEHHCRDCGMKIG